MRLSSRSYPYPVVGNRDDVPSLAFQAALDMSSDTNLSATSRLLTVSHSRRPLT